MFPSFQRLGERAGVNLGPRDAASGNARSERVETRSFVTFFRIISSFLLPSFSFRFFFLSPFLFSQWKEIVTFAELFVVVFINIRPIIYFVLYNLQVDAPWKIKLLLDTNSGLNFVTFNIFSFIGNNIQILCSI